MGDVCFYPPPFGGQNPTVQRLLQLGHQTVPFWVTLTRSPHLGQNPRKWQSLRQ